MLVMAGGEYGRGLYIGEQLDEKVRRKNKLIRVLGILQYPIQTALLGNTPFPRMPLPYGAVVRMPVRARYDGPAAANEEEYAEMVEEALLKRIQHVDGWEKQMLMERLGKKWTGIDKGYCTK